MVYEELDSLLTDNEKKIYLALLKLGESTASPILEKTGLQNSVFYRTIHRLMEKGFVGYVLKGKIKHFKANSPNIFLNQLKDKQEKLKQIIPELKEIQKLSETKVEAEVFVGIKGILAMYYSLIENAKKNEIYLFFGPTLDAFKESMEKVYLPFRKYRKKKKLKVYGLINKELKGKVKGKSNLQEKYTNSPLPPNMAIFRNKVVIASWGEIPTGILIKGKDIAKQYKDLFWEIWKKTKN